jgi:hypothetical protein
MHAAIPRAIARWLFPVPLELEMHLGPDVAQRGELHLAGVARALDRGPRDAPVEILLDDLGRVP